MAGHRNEPDKFFVQGEVVWAPTWFTRTHMEQFGRLYERAHAR